MSLDDAHPSYFSVQRDHRPWKANRGAAAAANSDGSRNVFIITQRYTHTHTAVQTPSSGRAAARFTFVPSIDLPLPPLFFFPRSGEISGLYFRLLGWGFTQNNHNYPLASFFLNFPEGEYLHDSTLPLEGSQTFQNGAQAKLPVVHTPAEEEFTSKTIVGLFGFRHTHTHKKWNFPGKLFFFLDLGESFLIKVFRPGKVEVFFSVFRLVWSQLSAQKF